MDGDYDFAFRMAYGLILAAAIAAAIVVGVAAFVVGAWLF